ncbi:AraC family transcriptional regulator [Spirochaetia bacterium]|nr:AraC family transcriptional regulator [Spirochaetia bacterium]
MTVFDQYIYPERPQLDDDVVVFHSGFCSTLPDYSYGRDVRDYYLIHYCTGGKGTYFTGGVSYNLSEYDGFLILPNTPIVHKADSKDPWDLCWVAFFGKKVDALLKQANLGNNNLIFRYDQDDYLETCIRNVYDESRNRRNIATINGYFYLFVGRLIDNYQNKLNKDKTKLTSFSRFDDAINYLNRNVQRSVTVEELSYYLRLDTSQVYRIFKTNAGVSPQQYITNMRMQKACKLLAKTDLTIKDVSEWLHFEYQSHFTKLFKNYTGITPTEYRSTAAFGKELDEEDMIP